MLRRHRVPVAGPQVGPEHGDAARFEPLQQRGARSKPRKAKEWRSRRPRGLAIGSRFHSGDAEVDLGLGAVDRHAVEEVDLREQVLTYGLTADLLLLVTPALDPALQMDLDFLQELKGVHPDLPIVTIVTQVDRVRPLREWAPPYDWQSGMRPKEVAIREATAYRNEFLAEYCDLVLPLVNADPSIDRLAWGMDTLSLALLESIEPSKQIRLARFLRDLDARIVAAAKIIDRYSLQMTTTQGLTQLLKSPVLEFISTITTGTPALAQLLAAQIPVEQLPVVIGKLQMAYELHSLLNNSHSKLIDFDLLSLWSLLMNNAAAPNKNAYAFGHALVEYWTQSLTVQQLQIQFDRYLQD